MSDPLPFFTIGDGPPLVVLMFTPDAANPTGLARWSATRMVRPFARHFTVHVVNRPAGLPANITMTRLAQVYADGLATMFDHPVPVLAISTGASIALQLAADHDNLVERMVLGGTAHTLGPIGKHAQRNYIERATAGRRPSPALATVVTASTVGQRLISGLLWLSDGRKDRTDAVAVLNAEDGFDLCDRLSDVTAPTLIIQGERDRVYPIEFARRTAEGIPGARLVVYSGISHSGTFTDKRFARDALAFLVDDAVI
ncbi:alpha/beta hydrolase [Hamadaea sp. NPDC051192]|uniref:alpha/beta fold hydrolase n=1 Tax=Hamadaea sp. NPDC051192 TaxID=3154940 RepID=UPI00344327E4